MFLSNLIVLVCNFCFSNSAYNKANIFLGLIEYELNSLLGASHLVDYISIHIRFDLERYLLNSSFNLKLWLFVSHCSANFQSILDCFIPNFYEDSENVQADRVNTVVFNSRQIKRRAFQIKIN